MLAPTWRTCTELWDPRQAEGKGCGLPNLAKQARCGAPATVVGIDPNAHQL
jgi:hypothetical protein